MEGDSFSFFSSSFCLLVVYIRIKVAYYGFGVLLLMMLMALMKLVDLMVVVDFGSSLVR